MKTKYPPIDPYETGWLDTNTQHRVYYEVSGNPRGVPVIFLHGGPGTGTDPGHRCYFDPQIYRIILMDQRGSGKSTPHACLEHNTTWDLIDDMEAIRHNLKIDRWMVFGGSWGSTLALSYAIKHPSRVLALVVRGIFLLRQKELDWFYQFGAHHLLTDAWEQYLEPIPVEERKDLIHAYYQRLTSSDPAVRKFAASRWAAWEGAALKLFFDPKLYQELVEDTQADALSRIECHYFVHHGFFEHENWILENIHQIEDIPGIIVQGRYDLVTPFESAWELHRAWPKAEFEVIKDAGHAASEPGILDALIRATEFFGKKLQGDLP